MNKNLCTVPDCRDFGKYCRQHLADEETATKASDKEYLKVRAEFLKVHKVCQFGTCTKLATEVHHKKGRGKRYKTDPKTFMAVCSGHHKFIEQHPHFAKEKGYSESRLTHENKTV